MKLRKKTKKKILAVGVLLLAGIMTKVLGTQGFDVKEYVNIENIVYADTLEDRFNAVMDSIFESGTEYFLQLTDKNEPNENETPETVFIGEITAWDGITKIPVYDGDAWVPLNENVPFFKIDEITTESYEFYPELDSLGRCGQTVANIGYDLMPTEKREEIGMIKPTGWHTVKYPELIKDRYLYNRCHLIGFQLSGENANEKNLITGTRYLNIEGMLDHENLIAEYVRKTKNHVLYRVTPIFAGNDLVCRGVEMEAVSVEDNGKGVNFHIFAYNVQPGITIDYRTGESWVTE